MTTTLAFDLGVLSGSIIGTIAISLYTHRRLTKKQSIRKNNMIEGAKELAKKTSGIDLVKSAHARAHNQKSFNKALQQEEEAELFARCLLMPSLRFLEEWKRCKGDIATMCVKFAVEPKNIKDRLKDLQLS